MKTLRIFRRIAAVAALTLLLATSALAQLQAGNLYVQTLDDQGQAMAGVTLTVQGDGSTQAEISNAEGRARFLGLAPGRYAVTAQLEGFTTVDYPNIDISVGRTNSIEIALSPAFDQHTPAK